MCISENNKSLNVKEEKINGLAKIEKLSSRWQPEGLFIISAVIVGGRVSEGSREFRGCRGLRVCDSNEKTTQWGRA